jgi:hypothetical protein
MAGGPAIHGIIAYPITPFGRDGGVDTATLTALLESSSAQEFTPSLRSEAPAKPLTSPKTSSTVSSTRPSTPLAAESR